MHLLVDIQEEVNFMNHTNMFQQVKKQATIVLMGNTLNMCCLAFKSGRGMYILLSNRRRIACGLFCISITNYVILMKIDIFLSIIKEV
jgi:hypothetical protein